MDTASLHVFEAVARTGGMNRAAAELNTVQSAVTARIRSLESVLGCPLFERHSRGVALTASLRSLPRRIGQNLGLRLVRFGADFIRGLHALGAQLGRLRLEGGAHTIEDRVSDLLRQIDLRNTHVDEFHTQLFGGGTRVL